MDSLNDNFKKFNINDNKKKNKNIKKNKENDNNNNIKEEKSEEQIFIEELIDLRDKIKELKKLFTKNETKNIFDDKLPNFIIIEKLVDYSKIKQKIIEIFNSEDIFNYLYETWLKVLKYSGIENTAKDEVSEIVIEPDNYDEFDEKIDKKTKTKNVSSIFNKLLMNLNFFVPEVIMNTKDDSFKEKVFETIFPNIQMIKYIDDGRYFLNYFVNIFNIKDIFKLKVEKEYKEKINEILNNSLCFGINLINILDLQEQFPIEKIFKIISDNYLLVSYRIYSFLVQTYVKKDDNKKFLVIDDLFNLIQEKKNLVEFDLVYTIINNDLKQNNKRDEIILKFINNININLERIIRSNSLNNAIYYCKLIFENQHLFSKNQIDNARNYICDKYFNRLKANEWKENLKKLDIFEYKEIKKYLSLENLETYYYQIPLNMIEHIIKILKFMPWETNKLLKDIEKEENFDGGVRIIRRLNIPNNKIPEYFINERIYKYFNYKISFSKDENNPHNLIEYCLISQSTLDISIRQLLKRYKRNSPDAEFYLYVINELYYGAYDKNLKFNPKIKKRIEGLYEGIKYVDNYSFKDYFGPVDKNCLKIDPNKTEVIFINNSNQLEKILKKYFINSKYIGIDSEWRQSFNVKDEVYVSIIQLSNYDENCCIILDMLKLGKDKMFYQIFRKYFSGKIFVGFSFNKNDMEVFPPELKEFFEDKNNCTIYDLYNIYEQKYLRKCHSLKIVTEEMLGKSLCKYEQCSDWNLRPLSKLKLHYAALDALVCILIYKKIVDIN